MHKYSLLLLFLLSLFSFLHQVEICGAAVNGENPLTPKAYLNRYWRSHVSPPSNLPSFLLSKASPLNAAAAATFSKLAAENSLSTQSPAFCSDARLLCSPNTELSPVLESHPKDSDFKTYTNSPNFTNYGTGRRSGADQFKLYSKGENAAEDTFRRYSRNSDSHNDKFSQYAPGSNTALDNFNSYAAASAGGRGEFSNYNDRVNLQNARFNSYSDQGKERTQSFSSYVEGANLGVEWFVSYSKNGVKSPNDFTKYDGGANLAESNFTNYGKNEEHGDDNFKFYGLDGSDVRSSFHSYGDGGKSGKESFTSYAESQMYGPSTDNFTSYGKSSKAEEINFARYSGESYFFGDNFTGYGQGAEGQKIKFTTYGTGLTDFKKYAKNGVTFAKYNVSSPPPAASSAAAKWVEPGKFFRESMLKEGKVMPMPDIRDKMPKRSFLPRSIVSKIPFSSSDSGKISGIFGDQTMENMISSAIKECERSPSRGETKRCVGTAEDLIDFATAVLGRDVAVRTTENVQGWGKEVMIGRVKGVNGGRVTKSVSCHQSWYPYLLYYCHSVPKVRVYEADILDVESKAKINHGVAICHLDTSDWSSTHGAFLALGSGPGKFEVCHWIFENDMTWTVSDE